MTYLFPFDAQLDYLTSFPPIYLPIESKLLKATMAHSNKAQMSDVITLLAYPLLS